MRVAYVARPTYSKGATSIQCAYKSEQRATGCRQGKKNKGKKVSGTRKPVGSNQNFAISYIYCSISYEPSSSVKCTARKLACYTIFVLMRHIQATQYDRVVYTVALFTCESVNK